MIITEKATTDESPRLQNHVEMPLVTSQPNDSSNRYKNPAGEEWFK